MAKISSAQQTPAVPQLNAPFVDLETGKVIAPWVRFLTDLFNRVGASVGTLASSVYLQLVGTSVVAFQVGTNAEVGVLQLVNPVGAAAEPQALVGSPFVFTAPSGGTLTVDSGQVELSRDGGATYYVCGLAGVAVPVLNKDKVRVTWYNQTPNVVFFPTITPV